MVDPTPTSLPKLAHKLTLLPSPFAVHWYGLLQSSSLLQNCPGHWTFAQSEGYVKHEGEGKAYKVVRISVL